jgi:hypothetical protein
MGLNMWVIWLTRTLGAHRNGDPLPEMPYEPEVPTRH